MDAVPDRICVKRKRKDLPVDSLYVERPQKRAQVTYTRLPDEAAKTTTPKIPTVRATLPGEEFGRSRAQLLQESNERDTTDARLEAARRFHLSRVPARRDHRGLATFVEGVRKLRKTRSARALYRAATSPSSPASGAGPVSTPATINTPKAELGVAPKAPLKRPVAHGAEKAFREEWKTQQRQQQRRQREGFRGEGDLALAEKLNKFALAQMAAQAATSAKPKGMPGAPAQRIHERTAVKAGEGGEIPVVVKPPEKVDEEIASEDDDGLYVIDTYILNPPNYQDTSNGTIGVIRITEEEEELWNQYVEEEEVDDSDSEDENAEDHYGNDYPEDEVSSGDEHGQGAYGYRRNGSDDEEWDEDDDQAFSDGEDFAARPWARHPWQVAKGSRLHSS